MITTTKDTPVNEAFRSLTESELDLVSGGVYTRAHVHVTGNSDAEVLALVVPDAVISYASASSRGFGSAWATATAIL